MNDPIGSLQSRIRMTTRQWAIENKFSSRDANEIADTVSTALSEVISQVDPDQDQLKNLQLSA